MLFYLSLSRRVCVLVFVLDWGSCQYLGFKLAVVASGSQSEVNVVSKNTETRLLTHVVVESNHELAKKLSRLNCSSKTFVWF